MQGVLAGRSRVQPGQGWARLTAEAPPPPYDGPETASDLEGVSDLERSWTPKQEGRQTFGQSLGRGGQAQNSPQGSPSPAWPEALTVYSKQLPTCHGGPVLQRGGRGEDSRQHGCRKGSSS